MDDFKRIPYGDNDLRINCNGDLRSFDNSDIPNKINAGKGYWRIWLKTADTWSSHSIHRLVAELFVEKPERHKDVPICELQVNHKDGNKKNNAHDNLEWVTNHENMLHARETGLFSNEKEVLAKELSSGIVTRYKSLSDASRAFMVSPAILSRHLNSICAGMVERDGFVFIYADQGQWPDLELFDAPGQGLNRICDLIAENVVTGKRHLFASLPQACHMLGLNINSVKNMKARKGPGVPVKDWIFYPLDDVL